AADNERDDVCSLEHGRTPATISVLASRAQRDEGGGQRAGLELVVPAGGGDPGGCLRCGSALEAAASERSPACVDEGRPARRSGNVRGPAGVVRSHPPLEGSVRSHSAVTGRR